MIDLHSHSVFSDGTNTPEELIQLAEKQGLKALALTDHDTINGLPDFIKASETANVEAVPGIELSAECTRGTMHILGYFIDYTCPGMLKKLERAQQSRHERNREILIKLNKLGFVVTWEDILRHAGRDVVGRPHFASALIERGYISSKKAAFDRLLAKGKKAYVDRFHYTAKECIEMIRNAGGVAVLAHPSTVNLGDRQYLGLLLELKEYGLTGIEVYCSAYQRNLVDKYSNWAAELDLIRSGGTDFHGKNTPDLNIGTGFGSLQVPDEVLENLRNAKP